MQNYKDQKNQEIEQPKGIVEFTGMSLQQNKLLKFISCLSLFLIFLVFIVLHLISLRQVSFQMCQVGHLPFGVFHGSPNHVDSLPSVDLNKQCQIFLQQKWVYSESAENCSLRFAFVESQV